MKKTNNANLTATTSNAPHALENLQKALNVLNAHLSSDGNGKVSTIVETNKKNMQAVSKSLRELNELTANDYYTVTPAIDVIRDASVPAFRLSFKEEEGYIFERTNAYPTLTGMKKFLPDGCADRIDALRRLSAYISMAGMDNRTLVLTGYIDKEGKKHDVPTQAVAAILKPFVEDKSTITKTAIKNMLTRAMLELTDNGCKPLVSSAMLADFGANCVKGVGEWGHRGLAGQSHVGDIVLEYTHMCLNGMGKFTVKVD